MRLIPRLALTLAAFPFVIFLLLLHGANSSQVLVMRHCVRSTPTTVHGGAQGFYNFDNYSAFPFPPWDVAPYQCLPRGIKLLESYAESLGDFFVPNTVISDAPQRDIDTSNAILRGMNISRKIMIQPSLFDPESNGVCSKLPSNMIVELKRTRLANFPPSHGHNGRVKALQKVLGLGEAPSLEDIPSNISSSTYYSGGDSVASAFVEAFLMQYGGGLTMAWNRLSVTDLHEFLKTHIYYRGVNDRTPELCRRSHSNMASVVSSLLGDGENDDHLIVGHDGDLDCLAQFFNLAWETDPFPANATTPGSGLLFERTSSGLVRATMLYMTLGRFDKSSGVQLRRAMANFSTGSNEIDWDSFQHIMHSQTVKECVAATSTR